MKLEAGHFEQVAKLEHQVAQQQTILHDVRSELEVVNYEVCALRALVADPSVPTGPVPEPPPFPAPRTPPLDLLDIVHVNSDVAEDQNMETGESEDEWKPVRRASNGDRRKAAAFHTKSTTPSLANTA